MDSLINIMSVIGVQKTLIIACGDYGLHRYLENNDRVFVYFLPEKMLQKHDPLEKERIQHFVERKNCTQIVFVGTMDESLIARIKYSDTFQSLRASLKFNIKPWMRNHETGLLSSSRYNQLLLELHVITQCNSLMEYYFIRERIEKKKFHIRGLVGDLQEEYIKSIFYNGITYNNITSMN
ncbi:MAG: hypothetical protein ABIS36_14385 [Chryseolinea sp.]